MSDGAIRAHMTSAIRRDGPTVAIAIACCNQAVFLGDAIESALAQTYHVDEIIMVDDGSMDATSVVTARYPSVRYHYQTNAGLSAARNTGLALATSDLILFLDSDDILMPLAVASALEAFAQRPEVAFVYGGYREVSDLRELDFERAAQEHDDAFAGLLRGNHISMHGTVLYRATLLRNSGGFDVSLKSCEDYDVFLRLARDYPIAAYDAIGAEYRRHRSNMTGNHIRMMTLSQLVLRRHMAMGGLTQAQMRAGREGLRYITAYYSNSALIEIWRSFRRIVHLSKGCLLHDPRFLWRIATFGSGAAARHVIQRLRRRRPVALPTSDDTLEVGATRAGDPNVSPPAP